MASRLAKCASIVRSIAVFILLSDTVAAEEPRRCYWCGPLADQVHRSQRAPSCGIFDLEQQVTVCDKGYTHCAIVATSPPYDESRICVKFYQDECYSLYCNTTKTWRMVCACQGDLCNGPSTERELTAFAIVPYRKTAKPTRNKRALISNFISVKTKAPAEDNTIIIINNKTIDVQNDQPAENDNATNVQKNIEDNLIIEHGTVPNVSYDRALNEADENKIADVSPPPVTEEKLDTKTDKPTTTILEFTTPAGFVKESDETAATSATISTTLSMKPTSIEIEVAVVHNNVTPDKLPPPEALQQNVTPTKAMDPTTMGIEVTTENDKQTTTPTNDMYKTKGKNIGAQHFAHIIVFVITLFIQFCL